MDAGIRLATEADAEGMLEIYAPIVLETAISFETQPPTVAEFQAAYKPALTGGCGWSATQEAGLQAMPMPPSSILETAISGPLK